MGKRRKTQKTQRTARTPPETRRRRRRTKHSVVSSEPEKCLEKPESGLQPDNGVLQEPRR